MEKQCFKCKKTKDLGDFYVHRMMADGHLGKCKECTKLDVRLRSIIDHEKVAEYDRKRSKMPRRKEHLENNARAWNAKYPERYKAHYLLRNAVRDSRIVKSPICEVCGKGGKIHGHHTDYSRPLEVVWLCAQCHGQIQ